MTVNTTTSRADYTGNGVTTAFTVPFYFLDNTHIAVLRTDVSTGVITTLTLASDYTVSGAGVSGGGTVTCTVAPTSSQKISILRNVPLTQLAHYVPNDPFPAATHEQALDQLTMEVQQVNEIASRALTLPANTASGTVSAALPTPQANSIIGWNSTGTALQNTSAQSLATVVAYGTANSDIFTGDGTTKTFTLTGNPGTINNLDVSISGVTQLPVTDYTWTGGTTLTFVAAPPSGAKILARYAQALALGTADAASTQYIPSGAGAVTTTVQAALRRMVSVKDFGAVGDGVTDDTAAIQAAINSVKTLGGGAVTFPYGNYKVTSSLSVAGNFGYAGVQLIGNNSTITSTSNSPALLIDAYAGGGGASAPEYRINAVIDGFYFNGPGVGLTSSVGIKAQYSASVIVRNCSIRNFYRGLQGVGVLISRFDGLNIWSNAIGIDFNYSITPLAFGCNDNHFIACKIWKNTKAIFYSTGGGGSVTFDFCEIESNNLSSTGVTDGAKVIELYLAGKVTFNGCYIEENRGQYNIIYSGQDATGSLNFIGTQFLLNGTTGYGIFLDNTAGVVNSLTMIGCSIGTCATSDLHIGTGFSAFLINTKVNQPITGSVEKLAVLRDGKYVAGGYTSTYAPMLFNGSSNANNIGADVNGLLRFTDATGTTRYGYTTGNATSTALMADSGYVQIGLNSGAPRILIGRLGTATVEPYTDNTHSLGTATYRWSVVYAGTGTINTSDERNKQDIASLDDAELRVAKALKGLVKKYRFKDAVAEKGDGARIHVGVIAQEVMAAFEAEGLDAMRYAVVCYDEWDSEAEELDADGNVTRPARKSGNRYGVRYDQLLAFIVAAI